MVSIADRGAGGFDGLEVFHVHQADTRSPSIALCELHVNATAGVQPLLGDGELASCSGCCSSMWIDPFQPKHHGQVVSPSLCSRYEHCVDCRSQAEIVVGRQHLPARSVNTARQP